MKEDNNLTPNDYFQELKGSLDKVSLKQLENSLKQVEAEMIKARELGQKSLTHKTALLHQVIEKEIILNAIGYNIYLDRQEVTKFIDKVEPKGSVKITELENFSRAIPDENAKVIKKMADMKIFDSILIIYTDLTKEDTKTPEQQKFVAANRDPIAVGVFSEDTTRFRHDRMYFITDWEDEFCDLTLSNMMSRMAEMKINDGEIKTLPQSYDADYITRIVEESNREIDESKSKLVYSNMKTKGRFAQFWDKIFG